MMTNQTVEVKVKANDDQSEHSQWSRSPSHFEKLKVKNEGVV